MEKKRDKMKLVHPMTEQRKKELQLELDFQRDRFMKASQNAAGELLEEYHPRKWIQNSPVRAAIVLIGIGFVAGTLLKKK